MESEGEMDIDLQVMTIDELIDLGNKTKSVLSKRQSEEAVVKKNDFLSVARKKYKKQIEKLREQYEKVVSACGRKKIVAQVELTVDTAVISFDDMVSLNWEPNCIIDYNCSGKLLNSKDCGGLASDIKTAINNYAVNACKEILNIDSNLVKVTYSFTCNYNKLHEELGNEGLTLKELLQSEEK